MHSVRWRKRHGGALVIVVISGVVFAIVAAGVLAMSLAGSQSAGNRETRVRARVAAESALVIAYQELWSDPDFPTAASCTGACSVVVACTPPGEAKANVAVDTDGDGSPETSVEVTVTNCGAGNEHQVTAKVSY